MTDELNQTTTQLNQSPIAPPIQERSIQTPPVQTSPNTPPPPKPNTFLIVLSIVFILLLSIAVVMLFTLKSRLKTTNNTLIPTSTPPPLAISPIISSPSPTTILKEEYTNPFAKTNTTNNQPSNPFEQTSNPFDELAK